MTDLADMKPEEMTKDFFERILKRKLDEMSLDRLEGVELTPVANSGDGFMSQIYRLTARARTEDGGYRDIKLFIKSPYSDPKPELKLRAAISLESGAFPRETKMYGQVLPAMMRLLESCGMAGQAPWPDCWAVSSDSLIVLDDLKTKGYVMLDQSLGMEMEESIAAIRSIAMFHALSKVLNDRKVVDLKSFNKRYLNSANTWACRIFLHLFNGVADQILKWDTKWHDLGIQLKEISGNIMSYIDESVIVDEKKFNVLNHCDIRTNNFLFKYAEDGKIRDVKIVDYQLVNYNSFALDLAYFLNTSVTGHLRNSRLDDLLVAYCQTLESTLAALDHRPESLPTLEDVKRELASKAMYGLLVGVGLAPVSRAPPGVSFDNSTSPQGRTDAATTSETVRRHLQELLEPFLGRTIMDLRCKPIGMQQ